MLFQSKTTITVTIDFSFPLLGVDPSKTWKKDELKNKALEAVSSFFETGEFQPDEEVKAIDVKVKIGAHPSVVKNK
jgi:hypothetical protein